MNRTERIALFLALDPMPDSGDPSTWTIEGRPLDGAQVRTLLGFTLQDLDDVVTLMRVDLELSQS